MPIIQNKALETILASFLEAKLIPLHRHYNAEFEALHRKCSDYTSCILATLHAASSALVEISYVKPTLDAPLAVESVVSCQAV